MTEGYPKPKNTGGTLIRKVMAGFKASGLGAPLSGPILIAVSGGVDSMVLAHLLGRYGRRLVSKEQVTLLHLDHGWREASATHEAQAVRSLADDLGVGFLHRKLSAPTHHSLSSNLEEDARLKRRQVFDELAGNDGKYRWVLTAHHRDDVAETLLWRFLRGEYRVGDVGILFQDHQCLRPFLQVSKEEIRAYAEEEKLLFFEDPSNQNTDQLRAWLRLEILPRLQKFFPSVNETLSKYARVSAGHSKDAGLVPSIESLISRPVNRAQREAMVRMAQGLPQGGGITLAGGNQLKRLKNGWIIENSDEGNQA